MSHEVLVCYLKVQKWRWGKSTAARDKHLPVEMNSIRNLILQRPTNPVHETITPLILGIQVLTGQWKMVRGLLFKVCSLYHIF